LAADKKKNNPGEMLVSWWPPILAAIAVGAIYWTRLDGVFYFLHGAEGQGLLLAKAIAAGQGFIDLALPGTPAHVREPPLFYAIIAAIIKLFGFKLYPMKVFMWCSYVLTAFLAALFFRKRTGGLGAVVCGAAAISVPELFRFFTGPKSDVPFMALCLLGLIMGERLLRSFHEDGGPEKINTRIFLPLGYGLVTAAAIMTRSLGLALLLAGCASVLYTGYRVSSLKKMTLPILLILVPSVLAVGGWAVRGASVENPAGYSYTDWFLMDLPPDSLAMVAVDFHSPLAGDIPRTGVLGLLFRVGRHAADYTDILAGQAFEFINSDRAWVKTAGVLAWLALALTGFLSDKGRRLLVGLFVLFYTGAVLVWPMDDPRLLFPFIPLAVFYPLIGLRWISKAAFSIDRGEERSESKSERIVFITAALALLVFNTAWDMRYHRAASSLPTKYVEPPGFEVRFTSRATMDSMRLLNWAAENTPEDAVIMYHSPPPCRLFTGRTCRSVPYSEDPEAVRDYMARGGADYVVLDDWGKEFPGGPGGLAENFLRPAVSKYPDTFKAVHSLPGTGAGVYKVKKDRVE